MTESFAAPSGPAAAAGAPFTFQLISTDSEECARITTPRIAFKSAVISPKSTQAVIKLLAASIPQPAEYGHLKRAKKADAKMLVLVCPLAAFPALSPEALVSLSPFIEEYMDVEVPAKAARTMEQYKQDCMIWPCSFIFQEPPVSLSAAEMGSACSHMSDVLADAVAASKAGFPPIAARIVDPVTNTIIASSHSRAASTASEVVCHPLHSCVQVCVEAVATLHRAAAAAPEYNHAAAPYLCTGLDIYISREPDAMDAMGLVHSRIRRVFYSEPDTDYGVLESRLRLHELPGINHRYDVFRAKTREST